MKAKAYFQCRAAAIKATSGVVRRRSRPVKGALTPSVAYCGRFQYTNALDPA